MPFKAPDILPFDIITSLSEAVDLISPVVHNHHKQVAYIAFSIASQLGLSNEEENNILLAGALHDIGALSIKERLDALKFEINQPYQHSETGYQLLKSFGPFSTIATLVRYHHVAWEKGKGSEFDNKQVPLGSHIIHLADRVSVLIDKQEEILKQAPNIIRKIEDNSGKKFVPKLVEAFKSAASKEYFWFDLTSPSALTLFFSQRAKQIPFILGEKGLSGLTNLFSRVIDFRSSFTANHSSGVAATASALAKLIGFSEKECYLMKIAGYLHDLGKLAVPSEILEKPGILSAEERNVIKRHAFYTHRILETIDGLEIINIWASYHHERPDGNGYPFHYTAEDIPLGSRIMAVADVFTALTEDRPYRKGMEDNETLKVLQKLAGESALDAEVTSVLFRHFDDLNSIRRAAQEESAREYRDFRQTRSKYRL